MPPPGTEIPAAAAPRPVPPPGRATGRKGYLCSSSFLPKAASTSRFFSRRSSTVGFLPSFTRPSTSFLKSQPQPQPFLFHNPICFVNFKTVPSADGRRLSGECTKCVQNCRPQRKTSGRREEPQRAATARAIGNRYAAINIYLTNRMPCSRQQAQSLPHLTKTRTHSSKQLLLWKTK